MEEVEKLLTQIWKKCCFPGLVISEQATCDRLGHKSSKKLLKFHKAKVYDQIIENCSFNDPGTYLHNTRAHTVYDHTLNK